MQKRRQSPKLTWHTDANRTQETGRTRRPKVFGADDGHESVCRGYGASTFLQEAGVCGRRRWREWRSPSQVWATKDEGSRGGERKEVCLYEPSACPRSRIFENGKRFLSNFSRFVECANPTITRTCGWLCCDKNSWLVLHETRGQP